MKHRHPPHRTPHPFSHASSSFILLSIHPSFCQSIDSGIFLHIYSSPSISCHLLILKKKIHPSIHPVNINTWYTFILPSIHLSIHSSIHPSFIHSIKVSFCIFINLHIAISSIHSAFAFATSIFLFKLVRNHVQTITCIKDILIDGPYQSLFLHIYPHTRQYHEVP